MRMEVQTASLNPEESAQSVTQQKVHLCFLLSLVEMENRDQGGQKGNDTQKQSVVRD